MLITAAILLVAVSLMHSVLGGINLINPICRRDDLPIILGNRRNTVLTFQFGWHFLSFFWVALAALLVLLHIQPDRFLEGFLMGGAGLFTASGLIALIAGRGRHLSWVLFFPMGGLLYAALKGLS
ncbi:hypothetical protein K4L02_09615 [Phaeobacter inhibens]|uniref:hypothetical protein n=1 Tax=Phaeobacter inhibens TaxID=221822 RepID=UPI0021A3FA6A|nr:hypothetical protein [Phaeobacter inhibens]UWR63034.1 hypothetical protein K4L02_09615 [Phaeobacter inhibens]UWR98923.1 hypothetical protein K4L03_10840 [Phaeobacter inhibens]UWS02809.1 hypothetical protein K4K94_10800 [Phaeobacter inhibens]